MAARVARSIFAMRFSSASILTKRFFVSAASERPPLPWFSRSTFSPGSFGAVVPGASLLNDFQYRPGQSASMSHLSIFEGDGEEKLQSLGFDSQHWIVFFRKPSVDAWKKEELIDDYVKTLAKVLGSEEDARKKMYDISCDGYFGFGAEVDKETAGELEGATGVLCVLPDVSKKHGNDQVWREGLPMIYEAYAKYT